MRVVCVIPARLGSTRLSHKPLQLLAGEPLIRHVAGRVLAMSVFDRVVVATDSERVMAAVDDLDVEPCMTGPAATGTDRVAQVARLHRYRSAPYFVNIQGDEPFIPRAAVAGPLALVQEGGCPLATAAVTLEPADLGNPHVTKVWMDERGRALGFARRPDDGAVRLHKLLRHVGVYAYSREALERWSRADRPAAERRENLEQLRPIGYGESMAVVEVEGPAPLGIDTVADLAAAQAMLEQPSATCERVGT